MNLRVDGLSFSYRSEPVLENLGIEFEEQEIVGILGPNGTGKTTMLRCINRILEPGAGKVFLGDEDLSELGRSDLARSFGYVAQRTEGTRMTVFDAVLMGRKPHLRWRVGESDLEITRDAIDRLGLGSMAMRPADELSGGEFQKVMIARALVQEPRVLLLDEPTASLDMKNAMEIMGILRRTSRDRGILVVMTIHDINLALGVADRLAFIKDGAFFGIIRPEEISGGMVEEIYGVGAEIVMRNGRPFVLPESVRVEGEEEEEMEEEGIIA